jgi:hypothetical protein
MHYLLSLLEPRSGSAFPEAHGTFSPRTHIEVKQCFPLDGRQGPRQARAAASRRSQRGAHPGL